jgi:hypothetical protein
LTSTGRDQPCSIAARAYHSRSAGRRACRGGPGCGPTAIVARVVGAFVPHPSAAWRSRIRRASLPVQADQLAGGDQHSSGACRLDRRPAVASVARTSIIEGRGRDRLVLRATTPHRQHLRVRCPNGRRDRVGHRPTRIHSTWASIWRAECRGRTIAADDGRAETRAVGEQLRECGCGDSQPWRQPGSSNPTRTALVPTGVSRRPSLTWRR